MKITFRTEKKGFTLIELMTALTITSVLILIVLGVTSVSLGYLKSSREDVLASRSARPILLAMSTDLESMHYRSGNDFEWLYAGRDPYLTETSMRLGPRRRQASNAVQLLFFSSAPDRFSAVDSMGQEIANSSSRTAGDVNLIAYRLVYRDHILDEEASKTGLGFPVFSLYRNVVAADSTYSGGQGGGPLLGQRNLQNAYSSRERSETNPSNYLAENIVEFTLAFEIEYKSRAGSGGVQGSDRSIATVPILAVPRSRSAGGSSRSSRGIGDASEFRLRGNGITIKGGAGGTPGLEAGRLSAVTISMTVITEEGMARIDNLRKTNNQNVEKDFFAKYTRNYTARIPITRP